MKKLFILFVLMVLCMMCAAAFAEPAVTDGETTGWIAERGFLYLQIKDGGTRQLPIEMENLLGMSEDELFCLTKDQRIIAVKKDGSNSRVVDGAEADSLKDQRIGLTEGVLTLDGEELSRTAGAYVTDGTYLYFAEQNELTWEIRIKPLQEGGELVATGSRDAFVMMLADRKISEPLSMTVTGEALTITGADHKVTVMSLTSGEVFQYEATSDQTAAACMTGGVLYRYRQPEPDKWEPESAAAVMTPTPAPTAAPTPVPTSTPRPTPTATPRQSYQDDDGTIYRGASGKTVRKIQQRLAELGYPVGKIDGVYGEQTQLAIDLFCDAIHVREHNYIPLRVQRKLMAADAPVYDPYLALKKGDQGVSVRYMQQRLKELGYDPGKIDGIYGKNTIMAVAKYQGDHGIILAEKEEPGENASREMLMMLYAPDETPTPEATATVTPEATATPTAEPTAKPTTAPATQTDL